MGSLRAQSSALCSLPARNVHYNLKNKESSLCTPQPNKLNYLVRIIRLFTYVFVWLLLYPSKIIILLRHYFLPVAFFLVSTLVCDN